MCFYVVKTIIKDVYLGFHILLQTFLKIMCTLILRWECLKLFVMTTIMTCNSVSERAHMLSQWIQTAGELWSTKGNMFTFSSVMEALSSPQVRNAMIPC